jgi:hypothetical protein
MVSILRCHTSWGDCDVCCGPGAEHYAAGAEEGEASRSDQSVFATR